MTPMAHAAWTRPALLAQILHRRRDGKTEVTLLAPKLETGWQALRLEQHLAAVDGVAVVDVNTPSRRIQVTFDPVRADVVQLLQTCESAGCGARPVALDEDAAAERHRADAALKRLLTAGIFAMQTMMFALVLYLGVVDSVDTTTRQLFRWLEMLSSTPVIVYAGAPFFRHALRQLRARRPGMDVPVALAVGLAFAASIVNTLRGHGEIWFDSASMLVFALSLGRFLEQRARHASRVIDHAAGQDIDLIATRLDSRDQPEIVAVAELVAGDRIHVAEGSMVPVDGCLLDAPAWLDTSRLTGESRSEHHRPGDPIAAGSVTRHGGLKLRVTRAGAASSLARLQRLTRESRRRRNAPHEAAPALLSRFIVGILALAGMTLAFWSWRDPACAFDAAISVLIMACPCAFALAAPATLTRAMTLLARHGVRVLRPRALHALARVDRLVFDKTGTLTRPDVDSRTWFAQGPFSPTETFAAAAALARESSHPLARAVASACADLDIPAVENVHVVAGEGIHGSIGGHRLSLGRPQSSEARDDGSSLWLEDAASPLAQFTLGETPRPGAAHVLERLAVQGIDVHLSSGDAPPRVEAMARRLGIARWQARQTPEAKHRHVLDLHRRGHVVGVVGDGNNDAAALAAADVSISLVDATDLARGQADVLLENRLDGLLLARRMASRAERTLRHNRTWGLTWNLVALPFAAAGLVSPWLAALGMSISSLAVVLNVLRMQLPRTASVARVHVLREHMA